MRNFIDQDRVDFVDDRVVEVALDHVLQPELHVVAQIVEPELVVGAVGNVGVVGRAPLGIGQAMNDDADVEAEEAVDLAHPVGVAPSQVVVDGDDMDPLAFEGVEIDRQGGDQGLAFTGLHLGDLALVEHHAAQQLDVEMALPQGADRRLAHSGEGVGQDVVGRFALFQAVPQHLGSGGKLGIRELLELGFQSINGLDRLP